MTKNIMIFGPTASGKTALAIKLAQQHDAVIINGDSRQLYKYMPILTAMPSEEEFSQAPHYLYDFLEPEEKFSAVDYLERVKDTLNLPEVKNKTVIISGGTGMYLKVILEGISPVPKISDGVVKLLTMRAENEGIETLYDELLEVDSELAHQLPSTDTQRIIRGLSVYEETGMPLSEYQKIPPSGGLEMEFHKIAINPDREELYQRINQRFTQMLENGLLGEISKLKDQGYKVDCPGLSSLGVKELYAHLDGELTLEQASEKICQQTRRYAKRQLTWLRGHYHADELVGD